MNWLGDLVQTKIPTMIRETLINYFYTYNNVVILRYTIQLKENSVDDASMLGRMVMYLTPESIKNEINNYLASIGERQVDWIVYKKTYSKPTIIQVIKAYNLTDQQPFTNYKHQKKNQLRELIPLIHVLCPDALENMLVSTTSERNTKRIRAIETNVEYCARLEFTVNTRVYYAPMNEYGVITFISDTGMVEYDSVKTDKVGKDWKSEILRLVEPRWDEVAVRGIVREAHVLDRISSQI